VFEAFEEVSYITLTTLFLVIIHLKPITRCLI